MKIIKLLFISAIFFSINPEAETKFMRFFFMYS